MQPLTGAYNCLVHRYLGEKPLVLAITQHLLATTMSDEPTALVKDAEEKTVSKAMRLQIFAQLSSKWLKTDTTMKGAKKRYKKYFDAKG